MSDVSKEAENSGVTDPEAISVKVNDKRRFTPDGKPIVRDDTVSEAAVPTSKEVLEMTAQLEAARKRVDELARAYQASERDREEFKVRMTREREQLLDLERGKIAVMVIEAIDALDLSLRNADASPLAQGVRLIRENLVKQVEATGVTRAELVGQHYDPNLAEAADMEITGVPEDDGLVVEALNACYVFKGRVIRPGRVKVAKYVKPAVA